jgi:CarD family transcriptional regulator
MSLGSEFEVGSWVVYPAHGVGRLDGIDSFDINNEKVEFFVVSFAKNNLVVRLPVKKAIDSGLRHIFSKKDFDTAIEILSQKARRKRTMWSKRAQEYEAKINSGDPVAIAEVIRDLYRNGNESTQSFSERQIYQNALDRFARELAIIESVDDESAAKKIETILQAA